MHQRTGALVAQTSEVQATGINHSVCRVVSKKVHIRYWPKFIWIYYAIPFMIYVHKTKFLALEPT